MTEAAEARVLRRKESEAIYRASALTAVAHLVLALLWAYLLRDGSERSNLYFWLGTLAAVELAWLGFVMIFRRSDLAGYWQQRWNRYLAVKTLFSAVIWGVGAAALLFPSAGDATQQLAMVLVLSAVAATAIGTHAAAYTTGVMFIWAVLFPPAVRFFALDTLHGQVVAALLFVLAAALTTILRIVSASQARAFELERAYDGLNRDCRLYRANFDQAKKLAPLGNWLWNLRDGRMDWSDETFALFGLESGAALDEQTILAAIYWADRPAYKAAAEHALNNGGTFDREFRVVHPDGGVRVLHDTGEVLYGDDGEAHALAGVVCDITGQVDAAKKARNAYREFNRILNHMQDTYYHADPTGRLTLVSRSMKKLLGYRPADCVGMRIADLYAVTPHGQTFLIDLHARGGNLRNYEMQVRHKEGHRVWVSLNAQFVRDDKGNVAGIEGTIRDITELKEAQHALQQEKERALVTLQSIGDGVIATNEYGEVQYLNPSAERLLGYNASQAAGAHYLDILKLVDEATGESLGDLVKACLTRETGVIHADEGLLVQPDGARYHIKVTAAPMRDQYGHVVGAVLALHDITEVMGMARQLSYQASHDMLTGLKNRLVFERRVEDAIRDAQLSGNGHVVFYMDLDQFKVVNDTCGHKAGDELLQQIAQLMQEKVRDSDVLARLGGDEFGVLLEHCPVEKARGIAEAIRLTIRDFRFVWGDKAFDIGVSIGVVPVESDSGNLADVLAAADAACYVAKDSGRNRIHVYQPDDHAVVKRHGEMEWVHRLSSAFSDDRFQLYAQPVAHLASDRLVSHYEILLRMVDERGRVVPPGAFIPAAERYNLMPTVDRWVLRATFEAMRRAQGELAFPPVECAINLSGQSICDEHFLEFVVDLFSETGIPCESICFELTETAAIANLSRATRFINILRGMGCSFALDDFGSGLSSFGYLKSLPVDYLKIDGGFVRDMVVDRVDRAMVESINQIGHVMGLKTIAEFAEDEAVLMALERAGVDYAQGSAIASPVPFVNVLEKEMRQFRKVATVAD